MIHQTKKYKTPNQEIQDNLRNAQNTTKLFIPKGYILKQQQKTPGEGLITAMLKELLKNDKIYI